LARVKLVTKPIVLSAVPGAAAGAASKAASKALAGAVAGALLLAACGQKGPLVLPGYPKEAIWPYPPRPEPKPEQQQRKAPDVPATSDSTK
jgi:predicted small lipoprotein YifL